MNKNDVQTDLIRGQLMRRTQLLDEQRKKYFKELRVLREQLFQKERLSDYYTAEDWGSYFAAEESMGGDENQRGGGGDKVLSQDERFVRSSLTVLCFYRGVLGVGQAEAVRRAAVFRSSRSTK